MHFITAGEAQGSGHVAVVSGVPAGVRVQESAMAEDVARWAKRFGQPPRAVGAPVIISGVSQGRTTGAPVAILMPEPAQDPAAPQEDAHRTAVRPATAELVGMLKLDADTCAPAALRAGAQTRACAVAAAGVAREFLASLGVEIHSCVTRIGQAAMREPEPVFDRFPYTPLEVETSSVRCPSPAATRLMEAQIEEAVAAGDTLGGAFAVVVTGALAGLGGYAEDSQNMAAKLAAAAFRASGVAGVEFGQAAQAALMRGTDCADAITCNASRGFARSTNMAGGIEAGMTTGMPVVLCATVAPGAAFGMAVPTVDAATLESTLAAPGAYDVCAVPAAAVEAEAHIAFALAQAYLEKFGADAMSDIAAAVRAYETRLKLAAR